MSDTEKILLQLTGRALFQAPTDFDPAKVDWPALFGEAANQALTLLIWDTLREEERAVIPEQAAARWEDTAFRHIMNNEQLLYEQAQILRLLEEAGIPCVILKGSASAACYPQPSLRIMGDIDILVKPEQQMEAVRLLQAHGYGKEAGDENHHCHISIKKDGVTVEVHREPNGLFLNEASACVRKLRAWLQDTVDTRQFVGGSEMERDAADSGQPVDGLAAPQDAADSGQPVDGLSVPQDAVNPRQFVDGLLPVPQDEKQAVILVLHKLEHFMTSGLGLRQMCDWAVFVDKKLDATTTEGRALWERLAPLLSEFGLLTFAGIMTRVCVEALRLPEEKAPWAMQYDRATADKVTEQILKEGNFGKKVERYGERLFNNAASANRITSFFRVLGNVCREHFPWCKKYPILMPVAPFALLGRYFLQRRRGERPKLNLGQKYRQAGYDQKLYRELKPFVGE